MCGRYFIALKYEDLENAFPAFTAPPPELWEARYNVAPTQNVPVVANDGKNRIAFFKWGLVPFWAEDPAIGNRMINARSETAAEKPSFRAAFRRRRCLVLANGFYEWRKEPGSKAKTPMAIRMASGEPFAFAGLWEIWRPDDTPLLSCTILTTQPNALVAPIHNRMPVILPRAAYAQWLAPEEQQPQALQPLLKPYPEAEMCAYPVSRLVNNPANDVPACLEPATG
ncbi:MAG: SOS response-associated peptidase [Anaerolineae bacterium]|nr:SOS response-associated peptidase [Anaerolineae bacterium]